MSTTAIILAAGKGTRLNPALAKVLHPLAGRPLVAHVLDSCRVSGIGQTVVVVGWQRERVAAAVAPWKPVTVVQEPQRGTGDAVLASESAVTGDAVVVIRGDTPLIPGYLLRDLVARHQRSGAASTVLAARVKDSTGYGRLVVDAAGAPIRIVEPDDASAAEQKTDLVASGVYVFRRADLFQYLKQVPPATAQGEIHLSAIIRILAEAGAKLDVVVADSPSLILAVTTPDDLRQAARIYAEKSETLAMDPSDSP